MHNSNERTYKFFLTIKNDHKKQTNTKSKKTCSLITINYPWKKLLKKSKFIIIKYLAKVLKINKDRLNSNKAIRKQILKLKKGKFFLYLEVTSISQVSVTQFLLLLYSYLVNEIKFKMRAGSQYGGLMTLCVSILGACIQIYKYRFLS